MIHVDNLPFLELGAAIERALGSKAVAELGTTPIYCTYERSFDFFMPGSDLQTIASEAIREHLVETAHLGHGFGEANELGVPAFLAELVETFGVALSLPGLEAAPRGHFPYLCWLPQNGNAPSRHFASLEGLSFALIHKLDEHGTCVVASPNPVFLELLAPAAVAQDKVQTAQYRPFSFQKALHAFDEEMEKEVQSEEVLEILEQLAVDHDKPH